MFLAAFAASRPLILDYEAEIVRHAVDDSPTQYIQDIHFVGPGERTQLADKWYNFFPMLMQCPVCLTNR